MNQIKKRLVNFRVTDDEFLRLKTASTLQNARTLSDFARSVALRTAAACSAESNESADDKMRAFDRRLALLESNVARIVDALAIPKAASAKSQD